MIMMMMDRRMRRNVEAGRGANVGGLVTYWAPTNQPTIPGLGIRTASTFYLIFVFFMVGVVGICQIICMDFDIQKHISIVFLLLIVH